MGKFRLKTRSRGMRKWKSFSLHEQLLLVTRMHFRNAGDCDDDYSCELCVDHEIGHCMGEGRKAYEVMDCMMKKVKTGGGIQIFG